MGFYIGIVSFSSILNAKQPSKHLKIQHDPPTKILTERLPALTTDC